MEAVKFEGHNVVFAEDQPEYNPLPAFKDKHGDVVTCWKLSEEELKKINETGELWLSVKTFNQPLQPLFITVNRDDVLVYTDTSES